VDKSLILAEPGLKNEPRYRMLDTVASTLTTACLKVVGKRNYAGGTSTAFLQFSLEGEKHFRAPGGPNGWTGMEMELGNFTRRLEWALASSVEQDCAWRARSSCSAYSQPQV